MLERDPDLHVRFDASQYKLLQVAIKILGYKTMSSFVREKARNAIKEAGLKLMKGVFEKPDFSRFLNYYEAGVSHYSCCMWEEKKPETDRKQYQESIEARL